jgi:hypothetical protein
LHTLAPVIASEAKQSRIGACGTCCLFDLDCHVTALLAMTGIKKAGLSPPFE